MKTLNDRAKLFDKILPLLASATDLNLVQIINFLSGESKEPIQILKRAQAAKFLGVSEKRIDQLASEGKIDRVFFSSASKRASGYAAESIHKIAGKEVSDFDKQLGLLSKLAKKEIKKAHKLSK